MVRKHSLLSSSRPPARRSSLTNAIQFGGRCVPANDSSSQLVLNLPLSNKINDAVVVLQYADDTAVIARADRDSIISFKLVLRLFTVISGLQINYQKSIFVPINITSTDLHWIREIIGCKQTTFPVQYLGMPLTLKRPTKQLFLPLVEKIERRLAGWQCKLLSRGGRLELVRSVLSTIPVYHMICFKLPKWVLARIDKARRVFLWGRSHNRGRPISLCNWGSICKPREFGGLGISDLNLRNISLLLRWWWKGYKEPNSLWTITITRLNWQGVYAEGPMLWSKQGSFFWGDLISIKHIFNWSTSWIIGNGHTISFWYDHWDILPILQLGSRCSFNRAWSLQIASENVEIYRDLDENQMDELIWRWTAEGSYSAKSVYHILVGGGLTRWEFHVIWRFSIPQSVKFFLFLLLKNKLLTREVLIRRSFNCADQSCPMCDSETLETTMHRFSQCHHSREIWHKVQNITNLTVLV